MFNKKVLFIIFFISILIGTYQMYDYFHKEKGPLKEIIIILDAGHGGKDEGATGFSGTLEKELNLFTTKLLQAKLESYGATVYLTREDDSFYSLKKRTLFVTKKDADMFISIHYNSSPSKEPEGITTFYYHDQKDKLLASKIHNQILSNTHPIDKGILFGDYYVLRENPIPSALLELGFISNKEEEKQILTKKFQENITTSITEAILKYVESNDYLLSIINVVGPSFTSATSIIAPNRPVSTTTS